MQKADAVTHSSDSKVIISLHKHFEIVDSCKALESINGASGKLINEKYPFISIFVSTLTESLLLSIEC